MFGGEPPAPRMMKRGAGGRDGEAREDERIVKTNEANQKGSKPLFEE